MTDPVTASTIAYLAFTEFVKASAGKLSKQSLDNASKSIQKLRTIIQDRLRKKKDISPDILELKKVGSHTSLEKIIELLDIEISEDEKFSSEVKEIANTILDKLGNPTKFSQQNLNFGRNQNIINQPTGDIKIGGNDHD